MNRHQLPFLAACKSTPRSGWNALTAQFNPHLRARVTSEETRDPIHCFWSNAPLSEMSRGLLGGLGVLRRKAQ